MRFLARLESDFEKYSGHGSGGAVTVSWRRGQLPGQEPRQPRPTILIKLRNDSSPSQSLLLREGAGVGSHFQQFKLEVGVPFPLRLRGLLVATGLLCLHLVRAAALSGALTASPHTSSAMEALCHSIVIEL